MLRLAWMVKQLQLAVYNSQFNCGILKMGDCCVPSQNTQIVFILLPLAPMVKLSPAGVVTTGFGFGIFTQESCWKLWNISAQSSLLFSVVMAKLWSVGVRILLSKFGEFLFKSGLTHSDKETGFFTR